MTRATPQQLAFADRLNAATGWHVWDPHYPGEGRLYYQCEADVDFIRTSEPLTELLKSHPKLGFSYNGFPPFEAGKPMLEMIDLPREGEIGLCLTTANNQDMEAAITVLETDARTALRTVMRAMALKTDFEKAVAASARVKAMSMNDYLHQIFTDAGDHSNSYATPPATSRRHTTNLKFQIDTAHHKNIGDMLAHPATPEIFKTVARQSMPVLNDPQ